MESLAGHGVLQRQKIMGNVAQGVLGAGDVKLPVPGEMCHSPVEGY